MIMMVRGDVDDEKSWLVIRRHESRRHVREGTKSSICKKKKKKK